MKKIIRVGSRESRLAVAQAEIVMAKIKEYDENIETVLVPIKTKGDIILDKTLDKIGGKGLFIKELEKKLLAGNIDIAVHSYKDMPVDNELCAPIVAVSKREDPRDVLILPKGVKELDISKPIGTSSLRRLVQIKSLYKDVEITPIRGNIITRMEKLENGLYSGIILAYAGLLRLGYGNFASRIFETNEMIPAACQGILAVQGLEGVSYPYLEKLIDKDALAASICERAFITVLGGGCSVPIGAYAHIEGDNIFLKAMYVDINGNMQVGELSGNRKDAEKIGRELARSFEL